MAMPFFMDPGGVGARLKCGLVLHAGKEVLPFGPRLWAAPIQALWSGRS